MQDLEEQIAQITNSDDFVKLCNTLLTAEYGPDFQVIDGTRSDEGNDGYLTSHQQLFAIYCPRKPERRTDADYAAKINSDVKKADELNRAGTFPISTWTFVTPRKLAHGVVAGMKQAAESSQFVANHVESTFLSNLLYKHKHLIEKFPFLQVTTTQEMLEELLRRVPGSSPQQDAQASPSEPTVAQPVAGAAQSADNRRVLAIRFVEQQETSKSELRSIFYASTDLPAQLNAILGLLQWWEPLDDKPEDMIEFCDQGIALANRLGAAAIEAILHAQRGFFFSHSWVMEDIATLHRVLATNLTGLPCISAEEKRTQEVRLAALERAFTESFNKALGLAEASNSVKGWAEVLMTLGNAAGARASHLRRLGCHGSPDRDERLCKRALLAAKDLYAEHGNELASTYAVFNLANQLSSLGEKPEAQALAERVLEVAKRHADFRLEQRCQWLLDELSTGHIPDYVHGERRERQK